MSNPPEREGGSNEHPEPKTGEEYETGYVRRQNREWQDGSHPQGETRESPPSGDTGAGDEDGPHLSNSRWEPSHKHHPGQDAAPTQQEDEKG